MGIRCLSRKDKERSTFLGVVEHRRFYQVRVSGLGFDVCLEHQNARPWFHTSSYRSHPAMVPLALVCTSFLAKKCTM